MHSFDESNIDYNPVELDESIRALVKTVPSVMGAACQEETYLCGDLLQVQSVRIKNAPSVEPFLRIDYEFWTTPCQFDAANPERVTHRREHIYIRTSVLENKSLFNHGLGQEYGFEEWLNDSTTEGSPEKTRLREEGYTVLLNETANNHRPAIAEHLLDSEGLLPQGIRPAMQKLYYEVDKARKESERAWAVEEEKRELERRQESPTWDLKSLVFTKHSDSLTLRVYSREKQFIWTVTASLLSDQECTLIEVTKGKKVPSPLLYVPIQKTTVQAPYPFKQNNAEKMLRDIVTSDWLSSQLKKLE